MDKPTQEIKDRLQRALSIRDMTPIELSTKTKIPKSSISQYMSGYAKPKQDRIYLISRALSINPTWLLGYDVNMDIDSSNFKEDIGKDYLSYDNIFKIEKKKFPLLGTVACGEPIFADEDRESYIMAGTDVDADFCLKCKGDSMINARINDGDIVFIKKQPTVSNGEIAVVLIDDEATLKRFYYYKEANLLILKAENPKFKDLEYRSEELEQVRVLGKAVAFQSDVI